MGGPRVFSLKIYLLIVCILSWPFQLAFVFWGLEARPLLLVSMVMVGVGGYIAGRFVFKDGFEGAGWSWGKPWQYVMAFLLALFLWAVPSFLEILSGVQKIAPSFDPLSTASLFLSSFLITLVPAFGEEFGWRGYMLPRLLARYSNRKALVLHGFITWVWHLPVLIVFGMQAGGNMIISVAAILIISLIPTILHAVVFAYFWSGSGLAVATVYHSAFDEVRDTLQSKIGFGPLVEPWQMISLSILGGVLIWKSGWIKSSRNKGGKYVV